MKTYSITILSFICSLILQINYLNAQLEPITPPSIHTPDFRVYISTNGNDANPGTSAQPVATFAKALELIPFNPAANVYGEIVFKAGNYYPTQPLHQGLSQFQSGGFSKNVSIVGEGTVNIYGNQMAVGNTMLWL